MRGDLLRKSPKPSDVGIWPDVDDVFVLAELYCCCHVAGRCMVNSAYSGAGYIGRSRFV